MKKLFAFAIILGAMMVAMVAQGQVTYTATFSGNDLSFESVSAPDGNTYSQVLLSGVIGNTTEAGKPQLPLRTLQLMIPFGKEVTSVVCTNIVTRNFQVNHHVYPAPACDSTGQVFTVPDSLVYQSNNAFPTQPVVEWRQGYFDGNNNIVSVGVCPFEYHPHKGMLKLITSMSVTVTYADGLPGGVPQIQRLQTTQNLYDSILYHMVDNPEVIPTFRIAPTIVEELGNTSTNLPVYEYAVVAPRNLIGSLHDFVTWKNQKGYRTGVVAIEDILDAYPGGDCIWPNDAIVDDAGSLRQYLHDAHALGTAFTLLVGDATIMPIRLGGQVVEGNFPQAPTDMYFSDLQGNWNVNHNPYYGELEIGTDSPQNHSDIYVGRLLCTSPSEISNWTTKLLQYEKNPGEKDLEYLKRALVTECYLSIDYSDYITILTDAGFFVDLMNNDFSGATPSPYASDIIAQINNTKYGFMSSINEGYMVGTVNGIKTMSGSINGILFNSYLVAKDAFDMSGYPEAGNGLDNLINADFPFVLYGTGSFLTPFDITKSVTGVNNFGESFTVGGSYGGVAFLGYTRRSIGEPNYLLLREYTRLVTMALQDEQYSHIGIAEAESKHYIQKFPSYLYHTFAHNLIGDPECQMWTDVPNRLSMTVVPDYLDKEVSSSAEVVVTGFKTPYSDRICRVTLYSENDVFKIMDVPVDAQGNATAVFDSIFPTTEGYITATATCYNHIPTQCNIPVYGPDCEIHITSNTTWDMDFATCCDVIVHPNVTLTIACDVAFCPTSKIKVLPGGILVLDGCKLFCGVPDFQWQGVRVYGTGSGGYQGMINGSYSQGRVVMRNNAEINYARVALDLWDGINYNTTGGIVDAKDAGFNNNGMAIRALYFQNIHPVNGHVFDYNAKFTNCSFIIDKGYPKEGDVFHHHVVLAKLKGLKFNGCDFSLQECPNELCAEDNAAIFAIDGGFTLNRYCSNNSVYPCPESDYVNNIFRGFYMGINAVNSEMNTNTFTVKHSRFDVNTFGIRTNKGAFPAILHSEFHVNGIGDCKAGVYLDNTTTFTIEDNTFYGTVTMDNNPSESFGTAVFNSKGVNRIYRNVFSDLTCANFSDLQNRQLHGAQRLGGLEYRCNICGYNQYDFLVPKTENQVYGIQNYQGESILAAGNRFSADAMYQFYNGAPGQIVYYQYEEDPDQILTNYYNVLPISAPENSCPDHYSEDNGPVLSATEKQQREVSYYNAYSNYHGTKTLYESYIDGGNTSATVNDITNARPEDMWNLRAQLLGASPFLSSEVMSSVASKTDVFPESVMFEIFAANPEELSRDSVMRYLEQESILSDYMIDILKEFLSTRTTYRSVLESRMTAYKHEYRAAASDIVRSILNDTVMDPAELRGWLGNLEDIDADRRIVASYMSEGNYSMAYALANMLPSLYGLTDDGLDEHYGYMQLLVLNDTLSRQHRTVFELTEPEKVMVDSLANYGAGIAKDMAKNILEANGGPIFVDCPDIVLHDSEETSRGSASFDMDNIGRAMGFSVRVTPNPATTWTVVDYTLPNKVTKAMCTLTNALGVKVLDAELNGNKGQKVLDLRNLPDGVYIYSVNCEGCSQTGKIVIGK